MGNSLLVVSAILMPFVFKAIQVLKDKKLQHKKMDGSYSSSNSIDQQTPVLK
jgi:hypothetical protein